MWRFISSLLNGGGPSTVERPSVAHTLQTGTARVVPVVVDTVYGVFRRGPIAHDYQKGSEVAHTLTCLNSPAAVSVVMPISGVIDAVLHVRPRVLFVAALRLAIDLVSQIPMFQHSLAIKLGFVATARGGLAASQLTRINDALNTAIATAEPVVNKALRFVARICKRLNGPSSESLAFKTETVLRFSGHKNLHNRFLNGASKGRDSFVGSARIIAVVT